MAEGKTWKIVVHVSKGEVAESVGEKNGQFISESYMNDVVNEMRERILDDFEHYLGTAIETVNEAFRSGDFSGDLDGTGELNNEIWTQIDEDEIDDLKGDQ